MTNIDLIKARRDFIARFLCWHSQHPPKLNFKGAMTPEEWEVRIMREAKRFAEFKCWRLARVTRNTGYRGDRWFAKGDIILAALDTRGEVHTWSWHPHGHDSSWNIGHCSLPNTNAIQWLEDPEHQA